MLNRKEFENLNSASFNLASRPSARKLIKEFAERLSESQIRYVAKVEEARELLYQNIKYCLEMDKVLGCNNCEGSVDDESERIVVKDGSLKMPCPILGCDLATTKLKRHLSNSHDLNEHQQKFALEAARKIDRNKKMKQKFRESGTSIEASGSTSRHKSAGSTDLVNRKNNFKECCICSRLCMNIGQHISGFHKIERSDPIYMEKVNNSVAIPNCFTKYDVNGIRVKLEGEELEQAKGEFSSIVESQKGILANLKELRSEISEIEDKLKNSTGYEKDSLKQKLEETQNKYKEIRYRDKRQYSDNVKNWSICFEKYLSEVDFFNPSRGMKMAIDVLLPYEASVGKPLKYEDLVDGLTLRQILLKFKQVDGITATSKVKYVKMLKTMIRFLLCDVSSPERKSEESVTDILTRGVVMQDLDWEIEAMCSSLKKDRGHDLIESKRRAESKLVEEEELDQLLNDTISSVLEVLEKSQEEIEKLTVSDALNVRDGLMAIATLRLGRRSKELLTMKLSEVEKAEVKLINRQKYHIVKVLEQKNKKAGLEAPVVFEDKEFKVLSIFINKLRKKLSLNENSQVVFPPKSSIHAKEEMSLSSAWRILQKFETKTGKKISSRVVRRSKVTYSRSKNLSEQQRQDLARSMSHSTATAERYYNYKQLSSSVVNCLSDSQTPSNSAKNANAGNIGTPTKSSDSAKQQKEGNKSVDDILEHSLSLNRSHSEGCSAGQISEVSFSSSVQPNASTPMKKGSSEKRKRNSTIESSEAEADETIQHLRGKKIKKSGLMVSVSEKERLFPSLRDKMRIILTETGRENFSSSSGRLSVRPVTKRLPRQWLKILTTRDIRSILNELLNEC